MVDAHAQGSAGDLSRTVLTLPVDAARTRKALVLSPRVARRGGYKVLVLLHGLAETASEALGLSAWSERYGLVDADARLRRGSAAGPAPNRYLSAERARAIDDELRRKPYDGFVVVCPYTPNVYKGGVTALALDRYADWIAKTLLPAVQASSPARRDVASTAIDGCSLGGYVATEVFLRKPELFGAVGGVQAAYGERTASIYARKLREIVARLGPRAIHIETSVWDPSLDAHRTLSDSLRKMGVANDLTVLPGGHDQNFLREVGTLEMLLWHDRRLL
ncbi:MAG TPA: alpha/beta hydrolase-fold protein [Polyangiaceae bacterium]|nr:alpha/beta hydrolase-fold protein [Polyangiaceae bacterium]